MSDCIPPAYPHTTTQRTPRRTELAHNLLVRASAGLVAVRRTDRGITVHIDGDPAELVDTLTVSTIDALGWLAWWADPCQTCDPATWWCCHLTPAGETVLAAWDTELRQAATA